MIPLGYVIGVRHWWWLGSGFMLTLILLGYSSDESIISWRFTNSSGKASSGSGLLVANVLCFLAHLATEKILILEVPVGPVFLLGLLVLALLQLVLLEPRTNTVSNLFLNGSLIDLTGDDDPADEDGDIEMGDSIVVLESLGGGISSVERKSRESKLIQKKYFPVKLGNSPGKPGCSPKIEKKLLNIGRMVIQKGNGSVQVSTDTNEQIKVLPPKTAEEILARERERKARTTLLMSILEDHLEKFHKMTDAKEMWEAIKFRFGGNDESKKMQIYILKQQFKSFSVSNSEGLHKGHDRFQSLLSQLEIHGACVSTKDANQKFFRSLLASWSQVSLILRTKPGVDT
ncbi:hypothetical protein Tco_0667274, partial [Tanacetum coccineum]